MQFAEKYIRFIVEKDEIIKVIKNKISIHQILLERKALNTLIDIDRWCWFVNFGTEV